MPTKTTPAGRTYEVEGKKFTWHPLDDNDELGNMPDITIPLRIKMKLVWALPPGDLTPDDMRNILEALIPPDQVDVLGEMDSNDFVACFAAWNTEYGLLGGASLGEVSGSPSSSASTGQPSTMTGAPGSV
jgi:hypothetical protein